jgi:hypothetical protein
MDEPGPPSTVPEAFNRSRALAVYGWVLIAAGALCALVALLSAALLVLARSSPGGPPIAAGGVVFNVAFYLSLGAAFVAVGMGSIQARRWARALALILAWTWLAVGVLGFLAMALLLPGLLSSQSSGAPPGMLTCAMVFMLLFFAVFLILLPSLVILFYRREDVRRTVELRNPNPDWTDRVPVSILGIALALAVGAVACVFSLVSVRALPIFGTVLTGWAAAGLMLLFAAVSALLAVATFRRKKAAWWGLIAFQLLGLANILTFRNLDMEKLMRQMGYSADQARISSGLNVIGSPAFLGLMGAAWVAMLVFLLVVRKHFGQDSAAGSTPG